MKDPRFLRLTAGMAAAFFLALAAGRLAFFLAFRKDAAAATTGDLLEAIRIGLKFDLRLALILVLPLLVLGSFSRFDPLLSRRARTCWAVTFAVVAFGAGLFYAADFAHFAYVEGRIDATALAYLRDTGISLRMTWETYPVLRAGLALVLLAVAVAFGFDRFGRRLAASEASPLRSWRRAGTTTAVVAVVVAGIYGKLSWYPLRWSDAYFSPDPFVSALGLNPILNFAETVKTAGTVPEPEALRAEYDLVADYLGVPPAARDRERLTFVREERPVGRLPIARPNVVVIFLESFAAYKSGTFANPLRPTPEFDALAREGTLFTRFYVPSHGTARSVFTALTGLPDTDPRDASSRNPLAVHQWTIVRAFEGWEKLYFLGGSASWGNIRGLLRANVPGLRIFEEGDYEAPRIDTWGISDLHLFEAANRELRAKRDTPFFAIIQTSGHHRPYTLPEDDRGFELENHTDDAVRRAGFKGLDEYNAFRFLDHSLGFFFREAKREGYFDDTLFVLFGDHGLPGTADHLSDLDEKLALTRFHVPLLLYAPKLLPGGRTIGRVASEVDLLPTVAGLVGVPYRNTTLGRDLFDPRFDDRRYALTMTSELGRPEIALLSERHYLRLPRGGGAPILHDLASSRPLDDASGAEPDLTREQARLCRALFDASTWLIRRNAPDLASPDAPKGGRAPEGAAGRR